MTTEAASDLFDLRHAATDRATIVTVPARRMFAIDGVGDAAAGPYRLAVETLFDVAEALRAELHRRRVETRVGVLECAWWTHPEPPPDKVGEAFTDRAAWHWQAMIEIPAAATSEDAAAVARSANRPAPVRVIDFLEGLSAQILQVGSPGGEAAAVQRLHDLVRREGLHPHGHLHEIHLADPRRVSDDRRRVILRLPIERDTPRI